MTAAQVEQAPPGRIRGLHARAWVLASVGLGLAMVLAPGTPPRSGPERAATEFSGARAWSVLEEVAGEPHPLGSEAGARVRAAIVARLEALEVPVEEQPWALAGSEATGVNVLARLAGATDDGAGPVVLFMAHHDSRPGAPGAGDDGAAVAAMLESLRALRAGPPLANELWFLLTDGEEAGLLGAEAFAADSARLERVRAVINFEGRGNSGPAVLFETGRDDAPLVRAYARAAGWPVASSLGPTVYERLPNDTDLSVFKRRGLPGLNFAFVGGGSAYHQPWDTPANLNPRSLEHHGRLILDLARGLGAADLEELAREGSGRATFFTLPGNVLVHYPGALDGWVTGLALAIVLASLGGALAHGQMRVRGLILGALCWPTFAALFAGVLGSSWWLVSGATDLVAGALGVVARPRGNGASGALEVAGLALWAAFLMTLAARRARPTWLDTLGGGALVWLSGVALMLSLVAPGASHVVAWPLAFSGLGFHVSSRLRREHGRAGGVHLLQLLALPALAVLAPVLQLLHQVGSVHPAGGAVAAASVLALFGAMFLPQVERMVDGCPRLALALTGPLGLGLLVAAAWLAAAGR